MPAKLNRVNLVESYDPHFGFITDAFVDKEPQRAPLMPRPAMSNLWKVGALSNGDYPIAMKTFQLPINAQNIIFAVLLYQKINAAPGFSQGYVTVVNLNAQTIIGSYSLPGGIDPNSVHLGKMCHACNVVNYLSSANSSITITTPGMSYSPGNTVTVTGLGMDANGNNPPVITVTSVDGSGGITGISYNNIFSAGQVTSPAAVTNITGSGSGATFSFSQRPAYGVLVQAAINTNHVMYFAGVDAVTGATALFATWTPVAKTIYSSGVSVLVTSYLAKSIISFSGYNWYMDQAGLLWNTQVGDPFTVNGLNFTQAFSDVSTTPMELATHSGYIVALGGDEIRFFQVTGATNGSAAAPILGLNSGIGCGYPKSVAQQDEFLAFLGPSDGIGTPVYCYPPQSLAPKKISYPLIDNLLVNGCTDASFIRFRGHLAYQIHTQFPSGSYGTLVYDFTTEIWYVWNMANFNTTYVEQGCMNVTETYDGQTYTFYYDLGTAAYCIGVLKDPNGLSGDTPPSPSAPVPYTGYLVTKPVDFGNNFNKQFSSVTPIGDQTPTSTTVNISYSNDNGQTFSTDRSVDISVTRPITQNLGIGRRRMWKFSMPFPTSWKVRVDALEVLSSEGPS